MKTRSGLILLICLFICPVGSWAAKPASSIERLRRIPVPDNDCKGLEAELRVAMAPSLGRNGPIIREEKIDWIVRRLESLSYPSDDLSAIAEAAFSEKPDAAYKELNRVGAGECIQPVHRMMKILINTAVEPGLPLGQQKKIVTAILKWFKGGRTPTLARTRVDFEIVESAVKEGLWKPTAEKTKSMERERDAMMSLSRELNKIYYGAETPEKFSLDKADFKKLQPTLVREVKEATAWQTWVRGFVTELP